jgi:hypothetical protein
MELRRLCVLVLFLDISAFASGCGGSANRASSPPICASQPPVVAAGSGVTTAKLPTRNNASLLARRVILGNPDHTSPLVSPDGKQLGWCAPKDGVLNVYVASIGDVKAVKAVTNERSRPVPAFKWAYDNQHILYAIDKNGDENVHVFSVDVGTLSNRDLTPFERTRGHIQALSEQYPTEVVIGANDRDEKYHDLYRERSAYASAKEQRRIRRHRRG